MTSGVAEPADERAAFEAHRQSITGRKPMTWGEAAEAYRLTVAQKANYVTIADQAAWESWQARASQAASHSAPAEPVAFALRGHIKTLRLSGRNDGMVEDMERAADALAHKAVPVGAETVALDTSAVWSAIADYVMATEALLRRRAEGHLMNAEWIDAVKSAAEAVDRAILAALASPAQAPSTEPASGLKCRDCADFGPICPNSGKPCATPVQPVPASPAVEVASIWTTPSMLFAMSEGNLNFERERTDKHAVELRVVTPCEVDRFGRLTPKEQP